MSFENRFLVAAASALALLVAADTARAQAGTDGAGPVALRSRFLPALTNDKLTEKPTQAAIVFLAEGYLASEQQRFLDDGAAMIAEIATQGAQYRGCRHLKFYFVFAPSAEHCSDLGATAPRNTAFGAFLRTDAKGDFFDMDDKRAAAAALAAPTSRIDAIVTLVRFDAVPAGERDKNDQDPLSVRANSDLGARVHFRGARVLIASGNRGAMVHELGHALYSLGDEYGDDHPSDSAPATFADYCQNLTTDVKGDRWRWATLGSKNPLLKTDARQGNKPIEGGAGFGHGLYHFTSHCRMNQTHDTDFCAYCAALVLWRNMNLSNTTMAFPLDPAKADDWTLDGGQCTVQATNPGALATAIGTKLQVRWTVLGLQPAEWVVRIVAHVTGPSGEKTAQQDLETVPGSWCTIRVDNPPALPNEGTKSAYTIELAPDSNGQTLVFKLVH